MHVRAFLVDSCVNLTSVGDGPVARNDEADIAHNAFEQLQRGEVVLDRVSDIGQVEHRHQDIGKQVAGDENPRSSINSAA